MVRLGRRLRALRNERMRSLQDIIASIGFAGTGFLRDAERGALLPTTATLHKIAHALDVELIDIVNVPEETPRSRLVEITRHLSQEALAELLQHAERLLPEEKKKK